MHDYNSNYIQLYMILHDELHVLYKTLPHLGRPGGGGTRSGEHGAGGAGARGGERRARALRLGRPGAEQVHCNPPHVLCCSHQGKQHNFYCMCLYRWDCCRLLFAASIRSVRLEIYAWSTSARVLPGIDKARIRSRLATCPNPLLPGPGALRASTRAATANMLLVS